MGDQWRRGLMIGIIASTLFALLVQPLLGFIGAGLIRMSSLVSEALSGSIYRNAARGVDYSAGPFFIQGYVSGLLLSGSIVGIFFYWFLRSDRPSGAPRNLPGIPAWFFYSTAMFGVVVSLVALGSAAIDLATAKAIVIFHQRITILDPVLDDMERKRILAAWASMSNGRDFDAVVETMKRHATKHGIKLPGL